MPPPTISELMQVPNGYNTANQTLEQAIGRMRQQQDMQREFKYRIALAKVQQQAQAQADIWSAKQKEQMYQQSPEGMMNARMIQRFMQPYTQQPLLPQVSQRIPTTISENFNPIMQNTTPFRSAPSSQQAANFNPMNPIHQAPQQAYDMSLPEGIEYNPMRMFNREANMFIKKKDSDVTPMPAGLNYADDIKARNLARKIGGMRGAEKVLPSIYSALNSGKTIDQIEDDLRTSGQSSNFSGAIRNAAQSILIDAPSERAQTSMDYIDDLVSAGKEEQAKEQLKRLSRKSAGTEEERQLNGKERTIKFLDEIQDDLSKLERMGISTNIFTGTMENLARSAGTVRNPEARKVATKIATAIINYRRAMSGAAFSVPESKEYATLFPGIGRTANFNTATISALKDSFSGDLESFYSLSMGPENYFSLYGGAKNSQQGGSRVQSNVPLGRVAVISQDGRKFTIPQEQLKEALSQGYSQYAP